MSRIQYPASVALVDTEKKELDLQELAFNWYMERVQEYAKLTRLSYDVASPASFMDHGLKPLFEEQGYTVTVIGSPVIRITISWTPVG